MESELIEINKHLSQIKWGIVAVFFLLFSFIFRKK